MAPVEDTTKPKLRPHFSDGELVAMISLVSDNKILLLGTNKIPICTTYSWPLVESLLYIRVIGNWLLLTISKIGLSKIFTIL